MTGNSAAPIARGRMLWREGRYRESISAFDSAVNASDSAAARLARAKALIALARYDDATQDLQVARELAPEDREVVFVNALGLVYRGENDAALKELVRLVRRQPYFEPARIALWQLSHHLGRTEGLGVRLRDFPSTPLEEAQKAALEIVGPDAAWVPFASQVLIESVERVRSSAGIIVECGVFHGRSLHLISARTRQPVYGFDSFEGLPEAWGHLPQGSYTTEGRQPEADEHVVLHKGWFSDTLPRFVQKHMGSKIAMLHIDCDLYSSTICALTTLEPLLGESTVVVFDDLLGFPDYKDHEYRALREFTDRGWDSVPLTATLVGREVSYQMRRR